MVVNTIQFDPSHPSCCANFNSTAWKDMRILPWDTVTALLLNSNNKMIDVTINTRTMISVLQDQLLQLVREVHPLHSFRHPIPNRRRQSIGHPLDCRPRSMNISTLCLPRHPRHLPLPLPLLQLHRRYQRFSPQRIRVHLPQLYDQCHRRPLEFHRQSRYHRYPRSRLHLSHKFNNIKCKLKLRQCSTFPAWRNARCQDRRHHQHRSCRSVIRPFPLPLPLPQLHTQLDLQVDQDLQDHPLWTQVLRSEG